MRVLRMSRVAAMMKSETLLHLEDDRRAEERSRLNYANLPHSGLTDGQNTDLLQYQDTSKNSSTVKYRRYGYGPILLCYSCQSYSILLCN